MRTFREFIEICEKYYEPDEPLPSGKTPYGKATSSYYRQRGEFKRSPNRTSDHISYFADFLPTIADIAGIDNYPETDGISLFPELTSQILSTFDLGS